MAERSAAGRTEKHQRKGGKNRKSGLDSDSGGSAPRKLWGGCGQHQSNDLRPQEGLSWGKIHLCTYLGLRWESEASWAENVSNRQKVMGPGLRRRLLSKQEGCLFIP